MAEVDYGDKKIWFEDVKGAEIDKDGKPIPGSSDAEKWFNKYFTPYLKIKKTEILSDGRLIVYFPDGSALAASSHTTRDWHFYPGNVRKCIALGYAGLAKCYFPFNFKPVPSSEQYFHLWKHHVNRGFEPWKYGWDGDINKLKEACFTNKIIVDASGKAYCTALIQLNNWRIPDDYPYKVSY